MESIAEHQTKLGSLLEKISISTSQFLNFSKDEHTHLLGRGGGGSLTVLVWTFQVLYYRCDLLGYVKPLAKTDGQGYEADNPNIELLRLKNFTIGKKLEDKEVVAPGGLDRIAGLVGTMAPFVSSPPSNAAIICQVLVVRRRGSAFSLVSVYRAEKSPQNLLI